MSENQGPGPLALVGSGEYLPQMAEIEGGLIAGRPPRYVQLATASVPDGPPVVERWHDLGRAQAERLGVEAVTLDVNDRHDAEDASIAAQVEGAGLVYLSGGHPAYLAETLRGTLVWDAIVAAWRAGSALAGCSAGAMAFSSWVPSLRHPREGTRFLLPHDPMITVLGIDEETAIVGGPSYWTVKGRSSAWRLSDDVREQIVSGTSVTTPLTDGSPIS